MTERKTARKAAKKKTRKKGGLGAGGKSLELDRPMGESLGAEVEAPPPPPPLPSAAPEVEPAPEPVPEPAPIEEKPPAPEFDAPPQEEPPAAVAPAAPEVPKEVKIDLDLLPWIVKKQLALDTDREDLDYEIYFWIEGKHDRLVLEGHRNDFGKLYVVGPSTPPGCWKRYADSEFAGTSADDVFQTYRKNIVSVLVRTPGLEIEFSDLADFLEWANY